MKPAQPRGVLHLLTRLNAAPDDAPIPTPTLAWQWAQAFTKPPTRQALAHWRAEVIATGVLEEHSAVDAREAFLAQQCGLGVAVATQSSARSEPTPTATPQSPPSLAYFTALPWLLSRPQAERQAWLSLPLGLVEPVQLLPRTDGIGLVSGAALQLDAADAQALFAALHEAATAQGWRCAQLLPTRWLLAHPALAGVASPTPERAQQQDAQRWCDPLGPLRHWWRLANEVQLRWHALPLSQRRARQGLPAVNSPWLSGCGRIEPPPHWPWSLVCGSDALLHSLQSAASLKTPDHQTKHGAMPTLPAVPVFSEAQHAKQLAATWSAWLQQVLAAAGASPSEHAASPMNQPQAPAILLALDPPAAVMSQPDAAVEQMLHHWCASLFALGQEAQQRGLRWYWTLHSEQRWVTLALRPAPLAALDCLASLGTRWRQGRAARVLPTQLRWVFGIESGANNP